MEMVLALIAYAAHFGHLSCAWYALSYHELWHSRLPSVVCPVALTFVTPRCLSATRAGGLPSTVSISVCPRLLRPHRPFSEFGSTDMENPSSCAGCEARRRLL